jgi:hypothetical protein
MFYYMGPLVFKIAFKILLLINAQNVFFESPSSNLHLISGMLLQLYYSISLFYCVSFLVMYLHYIFLNHGKGQFHRKQFEKLKSTYNQKKFYLVLVNPYYMIQYLKIAISHFKLYFTVWKIKRETETDLRGLLELKDEKETQLAQVKDSTLLANFDRNIDSSILDRESALYSIQEQLGLNSNLIDNLSESRIKQIKNYLLNSGMDQVT